MSNYTSTKAAINAAIKENGNNEITGPVLNTILTAMVNNLGDGYRFAGIVSPSSPAIETDNRVFVMATEVGTYTDFGGLTVSAGELAIFSYSTNWRKQAVTISTGPDAGKIDKVTTAVANDIAVFVAGGGLADSGTKLSDISAAIAAKYSKPSSGIPAGDLASSVQTSLGKADAAIPKVTGAEGGNFASFLQGGGLQDSGKDADSFADATATELALSNLEDADEALGERIDDITPIGRYLSTWDCVNGEPGDEPVLPEGQTAYSYKTGDYYIISEVMQYPIVGEDYNLIPVGSTYTIGGVNYEIDLDKQEIEEGDMYRYDGTVWRLLRLHIKQLAWGNIGGTLSNQTDLNNALNAKYVKPSGGIPENDLAVAVQQKLAGGKVFIAVYSLDSPSLHTPYANVLAAYNAGEILFCKEEQVGVESKYYPLQWEENGEFHFFAIDAESHSAKGYICKSTGWEAETTVTFLTSHQSLAAYRTSAAQDAIDAGKLSNPSGGTTGQVLTKIATGEAWQDVVSGMTDEQEQIVSYALNRLEAGKTTKAQVTALLGDIEQVASAALNDLEQRKIVNNITSEFSKSRAYNVGDLVMYKGVLYRCVTATTAGRPFTPSEWIRTTIMEEVIRLIQQ